MHDLFEKGEEGICCKGILKKIEKLKTSKGISSQEEAL